MWSRSGCTLLASKDEDAYVRVNSGKYEKRAQRLQSTAARRIMQRDEDVFVLVSSRVCICLGFFVSPGLRTVLWTLSLGFMGTLCLLNASRCGRIHCYFTGPFFILTAAASLGYGIGLLPFGPPGWKWIGNVTIIGAIVLSSIPEFVLGRYRQRRPE
jgi:hypothetical protein